MAVANSERVLSSLMKKKEFIVQHVDARDEELHKHIASNNFVKYTSNWISETIGHTTPNLDAKGQPIIKDESDAFAAIIGDLSADPFPLIVRSSIRHIPDFNEKVQSGKINMFPDFINGDYKPNKDNSTMRLHFGEGKTHQLLKNLGNEYRKYPVLQMQNNRW